MAKVSRFQAHVRKDAAIEVPAGSTVLGVDAVNADLIIWVLVSAEKRIERRDFLILPSDQEMPAIEKLLYIGTVKMGSSFKHVFERLEAGMCIEAQRDHIQLLQEVV